MQNTGQDFDQTWLQYMYIYIHKVFTNTRLGKTAHIVVEQFPNCYWKLEQGFSNDQ